MIGTVMCIEGTACRWRRGMALATAATTKTTQAAKYMQKAAIRNRSVNTQTHDSGEPTCNSLLRRITGTESKTRFPTTWGLGPSLDRSVR